ncbi:MAG: glucose-6-phosphate dehydrogenase assembly protein OpcA [Acidobacteriia bacterium]|nr:glucose-6-phosphate dehydrogenase assembly protein OpcA [Terriglobia bacterium]
MPPDNSLEKVMTGGSFRVDIASIEDQLRELWKDAATGATAEDESVKPVTRTTVLNLVVFVDSEAAAQEVSALLGDLVEQDPCRAIVITADPKQQGDKMEAWISAHCHRPLPTSKAVCCEQISLRASGNAIRELAASTVPFLLSDLPVFLWWRGPGVFESEIVGKLHGVCDRLIIDSKQFAEPALEFPKLQSFIQATQDRLAVSDMAWHRLRQWRELMAQFFDSPVLFAHLSHIENVVVEFNPRATPGGTVPPQAFLLAGWLASRLGWQLQDSRSTGEGTQFRLKRKHSRTNISILLRPAKAPAELAGHLVSFELSSEKGWSTTFRIARGESPHCAQTEISFGQSPPFRRTVPLPIHTEVELLARQLDIFGHDSIYEEAIAMAARLVDSMK